MANPLSNESEIYARIKKEGIHVPALIWYLIYRDFGEYLSFIEFSARKYKNRNLPIPVNDGKKILNYTVKIKEAVNEIFKLGDIDGNMALHPVIRELFDHYLSNDLNNLRTLIYTYLDPADEQPIPAERVQKIWEDAATIRRFLDRLREATGQSLMIKKESQIIKILVIDDEENVCELTQQSLAYIGFTVFTATNAKKALGIFQKERPKIIFLDIVMPDADGCELLRQFKVLDREVIVIMITASQDEGMKEKALNLGADDYIEKPFSFEALRTIVLQKIKDLLDKRGVMQKPSILIVDDEEQARKNLKNFISPRYTCDIEEAGDGQEAIEKVKKMMPDIVLLDIRMPGMSGIDVIGEVSQISPYSRILVISAWTDQDVVQKAMKLGAFDYIGKPLVLEEFEEKFDSALVSMGRLVKKN